MIKLKSDYSCNSYISAFALLCYGCGPDDKKCMDPYTKGFLRECSGEDEDSCYKVKVYELCK